jgi:hypothetical protein
MALALVPGGAAQGDAVVEGDVIADLGRLADHDAGPMIDEEAAADRAPGVDVDIGQRPPEEGQEARRKRQPRATADGKAVGESMA